jgi:hypothetical protein
VDRPIVSPLQLPSSLWEAKKKILLLPPALAEAYRTVVEGSEILLKYAAARDPNNPPVGGISQEQSDKHFAQAFDGSATRVQLAVLDPEGRVPKASRAFYQMLSGNSVTITDAPCGSGAASLAFLAIIAELRAESILPRLPLDVALIGAELSAPARRYAKQMLSALVPSLEQQSIFVQAEFTEWDVTNSVSSARLISRIISLRSTHPKLLLVVANFNAFLERPGNRKKAEPQLEELFRHSSTKRSVAVWIEPQTNKAIARGGLMSWVIEKAKGLWKKWTTVSADSGGDGFGKAQARFRSPLEASQTHAVRLAVIRLNLDSEQ